MNSEAYNKGREQKLTGKYDSGVYDFNCRDLRGGYEPPYGAAFVDAYPQYKEVNGYSTAPEWSDFMKGWNSVYHDTQASKRKEYKVDEFLSELELLCKKYGVSITSGDEWEPSHAVIKDYDFELDIK